MFGAVLRCGLVDLVLDYLFLVFPSSFGGVVGDGGVRRRSGFVLYFTLQYNPIPIAKKKLVLHSYPTIKICTVDNLVKTGQIMMVLSDKLCLLAPNLNSGPA